VGGDEMQHHEPEAAPASTQAGVPLDDFPPISSFEYSETFPALRIPVQRTAELRNTLSHAILRRGTTRNIYAVSDSVSSADDNTSDSRGEERILVLDHLVSPKQSGRDPRKGRTRKRRRSAASSPPDDALDLDQTGGHQDGILENESPSGLIEIWDDPTIQNVLASDSRIQRTSYSIRWTYNDLSIEQVLRKLLPTSVAEIPSAFETIGHVVHVNLRDELLPFRYWIGRVILDKLQSQRGDRIRTIVCKTSQIASQFRTFPMEVIAGDNGANWSQVTVREEGSVFELDYQQVYWNSRLSREHKRLVAFIQNDHRQRQEASLSTDESSGHDTVVVDLMAGVGPFAVPLTRTNDSAKKIGPKAETKQIEGDIRVYANDLNPVSYKYLCHNADRNRCRHIACSNLDGRQLVLQLQREKMEVNHFIMNLPASAPEFLSCFRGYQCFNACSSKVAARDCGEDTLASKEDIIPTPFLHVYCFAVKPCSNPTIQSNDSGGHLVYSEAVARCADALGCPVLYNDVRIHVVRDVSPQKNMICLTFRLPLSVADISATSEKEPPIE
jgi:tRNA (guanine37-N1)-methyltransferase